MSLIKPACIFSFALIAGCSATLEEYQQIQPKLELNQFFNGHLQAYGIVQNYRGQVVRRFTADILGQWQGDQGVLDEQFYFADGEQQHRCWRLKKQGDQYSGSAGDVIGIAEGAVAGNALNWRYQLLIPVDGKEWKISLNDWMYLVDENNLINRASMQKFGIEVGEITLYIRKVAQQPHREVTKGCELRGERDEA